VPELDDVGLVCVDCERSPANEAQTLNDAKHQYLARSLQTASRKASETNKPRTSSSISECRHRPTGNAHAQTTQVVNEKGDRDRDIDKQILFRWNLLPRGLKLPGENLANTN
jgi:hypothetical protein